MYQYNNYQANQKVQFFTTLALTQYDMHPYPSPGEVLVPKDMASAGVLTSILQDSLDHQQGAHHQVPRDLHPHAADTDSQDSHH